MWLRKAWEALKRNLVICPEDPEYAAYKVYRNYRDENVRVTRVLTTVKVNGKSVTVENAEEALAEIDAIIETLRRQEESFASFGLEPDLDLCQGASLIRKMRLDLEALKKTIQERKA